MSESVADDARSLVARQETRVQDCAPDAGVPCEGSFESYRGARTAKLTVSLYLNPAGLRLVARHYDVPV